MSYRVADVCVYQIKFDGTKITIIINKIITVLNSVLFTKIYVFRFNINCINCINCKTHAVI